MDSASMFDKYLGGHITLKKIENNNYTSVNLSLSSIILMF